MKSLFVCPLIVMLGAGNVALAQKPDVPPTAPAAAAQVSAPPPAPNTLVDGTAVKLRLAETISSSNAKVGQQVLFEVVEEVDVQGEPVIAKGAQALASVTIAEPKKSMGRGGKLDVNIDSVRLLDGEKAALRATQGGNGGGHTAAMTAGMVGTAIVFFPAAPLLLFIHGKDITIPKGTEVTAFVSGDMHLEMAKFAPPVPEGAAPAGAASPTAPVAMANLTIDASVPNCDIQLDGTFAGNTPSTLTVTPGQHVILVKKTGYADWTRTMMVGAGTVRLNAEMATQ